MIMATLIAVYKNGRCVRRCDKRCYGAVHEDCDCCCGGMNHAQGRTKAENNTYDQIERITTYAHKTWGDDIDVLSKVNARQLDLPLMGGV